MGHVSFSLATGGTHTSLHKDSGKIQNMLHQLQSMTNQEGEKLSHRNPWFEEDRAASAPCQMQWLHPAARSCWLLHKVAYSGLPDQVARKDASLNLWNDVE